MKLSVCMITYGHEHFINDAIDGVLMQHADFEIELIIADDCSPDKTSEVVQNIITNHPNGRWIKYIRHPQNIGMMENFAWALQQCTGKYIALCEGDDYWCNKEKLKKQVDFLEKNNQYALCYHRAYELFADGRKEIESLNTGSEPREYSLPDLSHGNFIHTPSVVFRREFLALPFWFRRSPVGDYTLYMLLARYGKCYYMPDVMAVYRRHEGGNWSGAPGEFRLLNWVKVLNFLIQEFTEEPEVLYHLINQQATTLEKINQYYPAALKRNIDKKRLTYFKIYSENKHLINELLCNPNVLASKVKIRTLVKACYLKVIHSFRKQSLL